MRFVLLALIGALLGGCATRGSINVSCRGFETDLVGRLQPSELEQAIHSRAAQGFVDSSDDPLRQRLERSLIATGSPNGLAEAPPEPAILLLSGGGQWGAFGAGYLKRLRETGRLPDFVVVTGVSTGALQSLFVAIGDDEAYTRLVGNYSPASEKAVVDRNAKALTVLTGSMAGLKPLRARIESALCKNLSEPCMLDRLAALSGRKMVLIGFVNAKTGKFGFVDAVKIAALPDRERARSCLTGAALASAAMPVFFQQVRVDGQTYYDGGVRQSVFEARVASDAGRAVRGQAAALGRLPHRVDAPQGYLPLYVLRNGPTTLSVLPVDANGRSGADRSADALTAAERAEAIVVNEIEVGSIAELRLGHPTGTILMMSADGFDREGRCVKPKDVMFDPGFMACLRAYGRTVADGAGNPWISLPPLRNDPAEAVQEIKR